MIKSTAFAASLLLACQAFAPHAAFAALSPGDLVVSEVMANPAAVSDTYGEWFELYNPTGTQLNLNGVTIRDDGSNSFTIAEDLLIDAGAYLVLSRNGDSAVNGGITPGYAYGSGFTLGNSSDAIVIESEGSTVFRLDYAANADFGAAGNSVELLSLLAVDEFSYQLTPVGLSYGAGDIGTPGGPGSVALPSAVPVPAAAWLFGSALGLLGLRRKA
ncbi:MAG: lamin tail domain-containing protein [Spongiibacteraceae bacterium]|jgi:hypothetical protein|nr:lamin tail domain-containing protein [Spongiibacteraceae bacterium]